MAKVRAKRSADAEEQRERTLTEARAKRATEDEKSLLLEGHSVSNRGDMSINNFTEQG